MRAVVDREASALGLLYDRYSGTLLALALRILRDRSDAEELLGDLFWEVWRRPERFDPNRGSLLAYLITLTRSRAIDRLRSRKRRDEVLVPTDDASTREDETLETPLEDALLGEQRVRIRSAMAGLKPDQRQAIELSFYQGLSHSEISAELQEPLGTVKSRIRSGLIQLRGALRMLYGSGDTV